LKAFRGVMVGYSQNSPGYRVYNPATKRITTFVHVMFQENVPGRGISRNVLSSIKVFFDADNDSAAHVTPSPNDHDLAHSHGQIDTMHEIDRRYRLRGPPAHVPRPCVTDACSSCVFENEEDFVAPPCFSMMVARPRH
jgi:hypothetical protein